MQESESTLLQCFEDGEYKTINGGKKNVKSPNFKLLHPFVNYIIHKNVKIDKRMEIEKGKSIKKT